MLHIIVGHDHAHFDLDRHDALIAAHDHQIDFMLKLVRTQMMHGRLRDLRIHSHVKRDQRCKQTATQRASADRVCVLGRRTYAFRNHRRFAAQQRTTLDAQQALG